MGDVQVEDLVVDELGILERAVERGVDVDAVVDERDAVTHAVGALDPAGVDQVDAGLAFGDALAEHVGVDHRVKRHEGLAEQGGEGGHGLLMPSSVPATLEVKPLTKWYMAASADRRAMGGSTPKASQVRKITAVGSPPAPSRQLLGMCSTG